MKKVNITSLVLIFTLMFSVSLSASVPIEPPVPLPPSVSKDLSKEIRKGLYVPNMDEVDGKGGSVSMMIQILSDGALEVKKINSDNSKLLNFVQRKVNNMKEKDFAEYAGKVMYMKVIYNIQ